MKSGCRRLWLSVLSIILMLTVTVSTAACGGSPADTDDDDDNKGSDIGVADTKDSAGMTGPAEESTAAVTKTEPEVTTDCDPEPETATVKRMLSAAIEVAGRCLYVWGGGWNEDDTGAGTEAMTVGVSPRWIGFFNENDSGYDYSDTRYQIHDGLDCSGFAGYVVYQVFEDSYSDNGYVFTSGTMTEEYKNMFGGEVVDASLVSDYRPGDIMGKKGHVYIVIGKCDDGSLLFIHASPPAVSLCGTPSADGKGESEAVALARSYMSLYRSDCYVKFDTCERGADFLVGYDQYRWDDEVLSDPDGYRDMSPEEMLADLFGE